MSVTWLRGLGQVRSCTNLLLTTHTSMWLEKRETCADLSRCTGFGEAGEGAPGWVKDGEGQDHGQVGGGEAGLGSTVMPNPNLTGATSGCSVYLD